MKKATNYISNSKTNDTIDETFDVIDIGIENINVDTAEILADQNKLFLNSTIENSEELREKRDKFRESITNIEKNELALNANKNIVVRKSSQFSPKIVNNDAFQEKNMLKAQYLSNQNNIDYNYNTISDKSSNYYPCSKSPHSRNSNYISSIDNQLKPSDNDTITVPSFRNKTPRVSFFLNQNTTVNDQICLSNSRLSHSYSQSRNSSNDNGKKKLSLHSQFLNKKTTTTYSIPSSINIKPKSQSFRENIINLDNKTINKNQPYSISQQQTLPIATVIGIDNSKLPSTNKFYLDANDQNIQNVNSEHYIPLNNSKCFSPISDNRFQDLLKIVKPPYYLNEIKDVNYIIEKNDALKESNLNIATREKMNRIKEKGYKLAVRAKKAIDSGDY